MYDDGPQGPGGMGGPAWDSVPELVRQRLGAAVGALGSTALDQVGAVDGSVSPGAEGSPAHERSVRMMALLSAGGVPDEAPSSSTAPPALATQDIAGFVRERLGAVVDAASEGTALDQVGAVDVSEVPRTEGDSRASSSAPLDPATQDIVNNAGFLHGYMSAWLDTIQ